jgi:hypothetical protein
VVDAVLNSADKVAQKIAEWKQSGAKVIHGSYVTVPVDEAVRRSAARAIDPESDSYGRHVPSTSFETATSVWPGCSPRW